MGLNVRFVEQGVHKSCCRYTRTSLHPKPTLSQLLATIRLQIPWLIIVKLWVSFRMTLLLVLLLPLTITTESGWSHPLDNIIVASTAKIICTISSFSSSPLPVPHFTKYIGYLLASYTFLPVAGHLHCHPLSSEWMMQKQFHWSIFGRVELCEW